MRGTVSDSIPVHMRAVSMKSLLLFCALIFLSGCDAWTDTGQDPPATQILDIRVDPNPVVIDEKAILTVISQDSTNAGLNYEWHLPTGFVDTNAPQYIWTASVEPGEYAVSVEVTREGSFNEVQKAFTITVVREEGISY